MTWVDELKLKISNNKDISSMQKFFFELANNLLNNKVLKIGELEIELTEIEFYFFDCNNHNDEYVHIDELQKTSDYLYVHKQAWRRGGIDITFGSNDYYGGILIRGIKHNNFYISGSATVKKYIASLINTSINDYKELQEYFQINKLLISLIDKNINNYKILHSTRIGLNLEKSPKYANALYRFIREDYLNETNKEIFKSYNNLKERTKIKAISSLTLGYNTNEEVAVNAIKSNNTLFENINLFNVK
jgi:hypothetical protein